MVIVTTLQRGAEAPGFRLTANPLDWSAPNYAAVVLVLLLVRSILSPAAGPVVRFLREVCLLLPAGLLYFLVRGATIGRADTAFAHAEDLIGLERALGIYIEPWVQRTAAGASGLIDLANWVYIWCHWPVIVLWAVWMGTRHGAVYATYRNAFLISGAIGLAIFALYPVAPPRFLGDQGFVDTVALRSHAYRVLQPPALANPYAALPSLHVGWNLLVGIGLVRHAGHRVGRTLGFLLPVAMVLAVVLTANHYLLDAVAGATLALTGLGGSMLVQQWRPVLAWRPMAVRRPQAGVQRRVGA